MGSFGDSGPFGQKPTNSYMEEKTDADGHHTTKKVTEGEGWKSVEI